MDIVTEMQLVNTDPAIIVAELTEARAALKKWSGLLKEAATYPRHLDDVIDNIDEVVRSLSA